MELRDILSTAIDNALDELMDIRTFLYENPEIGGTEEKSSGRLINSLKNHDFKVTSDYCGIRYAFRAELDSNRPGPVIGLFAEYDALPGIGHGCGHNLICTASLAAAYGLKSVLQQTGGKVVVFGTPGEENLQSKTTLAEKDAFREIDVAMMVHPDQATCVARKTRAIESLQIEFSGKSSHAGVSPEAGINALDAAVQCYTAINIEKQYYKNTNVYGIISDGGQKASVIPAYASLKFLTRAWSMKELKSLRQMIERCAQSAATSTGCSVHIFNNEATNHDMMTNPTMSDLYHKHLHELGETQISQENMAGSTDMGDVSRQKPSIHPCFGLNCPQYVLHSKEFADQTVTEHGDRFIERAGKAMALTALDILTVPSLLKKIREEFKLQLQEDS